jgi:hypothetical protein
LPLNPIHQSTNTYLIGLSRCVVGEIFEFLVRSLNIPSIKFNPNVYVLV